MIKEKFTLIADGYKYFHDDMYPDYVENITSTTYIRNPKMNLTYTNGKICVFGVGLILQRLENMLRDFVETFSYDELNSYTFMPDNMKYNFTKLYLYLKDKNNENSLLLDLLDIKYIRDGSFVDPKDRLLVIRNKDKEFRWLPNYLETFINSELWKGTYIATQAASYLGAMFKALLDSDFSKGLKNSIICEFIRNFEFSHNSLQYTIHDFSARGMSGIYDVIFHNVAHLLFFKGTDSVAIDNLRIEGYYEDLKLENMVAASEHSVMCSYGKDNELESIKELMKKYHNKPLSLVCDSYDIFELLDKLSKDEEFVDLLKHRNVESPLVIRGDSGNPVKIMTGNDEFNSNDPEMRNKLESLGLVNSLKELFPEAFENFAIKAIYGDAITPQKCYEIYLNLYNSGITYPEMHIVLGAGSYTYNYATRDSVGLVTKATSYTKKQCSETEEVNIVKNPKTDLNKSSLNINDNYLTSMKETTLENSKIISIASATSRNNFMDEVLKEMLKEYTSKNSVSNEILEEYTCINSATNEIEG